MKKILFIAGAFMVISFCPVTALAQDCSNLPTQFHGNQFPTGDFFSNFNNHCYTIPFAYGNGGSLRGDLNSTYYVFFYKADPRYQLIILGSFPHARYFSITLNDEHRAYTQHLDDVNIVPLTSQFINPYEPGVAFVPGQQYAAPVNFGGTPGMLQTGCMTNGYNVDVNGTDGTQRHAGLDWNSDTGFFQANPHFDLHVVDTPQHTNPTKAGFILFRSYLDISAPGSGANPVVILRDVASGCAYPAAYALNTLQVVTYKPGVGGSWLSVSQAEDHDYYENEYLPKLCNAHDHQNELPWFRGSAYTRAGDPDSSYTQATVPAGLAKQLAQAQEVMRIRLRLPTTPPTPCTNGCSRSGNEQMRYMSLSFLSQSGNTLASVADGDFVTTASGYATLIVGTGATIPGWVSVANGYTYLDLTADSGYQNLSGMSLRDILPASTFMCGGDIVPFRTAAASPAGGFMGDDLPVVDYPLAVSLPRTAAPLMGPNACAVFPNGQPDVVPACGVQPSGPIQIVSANTQCPASGCTQIAAQAQPPLTINGSGFGSFPEGLPYNGNSNYLEIIDSTQNWDAGYGNGPCTVSIGEWSTTTISVVANLNVNGACPLLAGDQLTIKVWNPQSPGTPATYTTTVAAN